MRVTLLARAPGRPRTQPSAHSQAACLACGRCQNLQWILCAVQGKLPHQRGADLHFATVPRDLSMAGYRDPGQTGSWWMEPHWQTFAVSDVFYAEARTAATIAS